MLNYDDLTREEKDQLIEAMLREALEKEKTKQTITERPYLQVPPPMPVPFDQPEEAEPESRSVIILDM